MRCIATGWIRLPVRFMYVCTGCTGLLCPLASLLVNVPVYGLRLPAGLAIVDLWASYHVGILTTRPKVHPALGEADFDIPTTTSLLK